MKKILFLLAATAITQTAFADIGTLYRSKTTDVKITKQGKQYHVRALIEGDDRCTGMACCFADYSGIGSLNGNVLTVFNAAGFKEYGGSRSEHTLKIAFSNDHKTAKITHSPSAGEHYASPACSFTDGGNPNLRKVR